MTRAHADRFVRLLALLAVMALLAAGCGGSDDSDPGDERATTTQTKTTSTDHDDGDDHDDPGPATTVPKPVPDGELPPIQVTSPEPLGYVHRAFTLAGTAQVFEGTLNWAILDASLKPMAQGTFTASCGAPCRGRFSKRIPLRGVAVGSWELHVWAPPVDEGDDERMHDTMVPITVTAEPVAGAPDPGSTPPGGVPPGA